MSFDDLITLGLLGAAYFLPTLVAAMSGKDVGGCFGINLLFGWTIVGWVICMAMAVVIPTRKEVEYRRQVQRARDEFYLRATAERPAALEPAPPAR